MKILLIVIAAYLIMGTVEWYSWRFDAPMSDPKEYFKTVLLWPFYFIYRHLF